MQAAGVDALAILHDVMYAEPADSAHACRDEGRLGMVILDTIANSPRANTYGGAIAPVIAHNMQSRLLGVNRGSRDFRRLRRECDAGMPSMDNRAVAAAGDLLTRSDAPRTIGPGNIPTPHR